MSRNEERWGSDLRLLRNLDYQTDRDPGRDLGVITRPETRQRDLETLAGADNLKQALLLRFLTPAGELALLGHPQYGSRLFELLGELNTDTTRNRAKLYVLQALAAEARVKEVLSVQVTQSAGDRARIDISISLLAIDNDTILNLVFPFFLEGGVAP